MSQFADNQYEKALRKRCDCDAKGTQNPPPQLHLHNIATHYGKTVEQVISDIEAMRTPKEVMPDRATPTSPNYWC